MPLVSETWHLAWGRQKRLWVGWALALLLVATPTGPAAAREQASRWIASWASAQLAPGPRDAIAPDELRDATLRQIVRLSLGGTRLRVRVSNAFGTAPLRIEALRIARAPRAGTAAIVAGSDRPLLFAGAEGVVIPEGADYWSDPVDLPVPALAHVTVTMHLAEPPAQQTGHPGSWTSSYLLRGRHISDADLVGAKRIDHWYQLAAVEVQAPAGATAIVTLGDSITDGHGATTNGDDRWPDLLAARLQQGGRTRTLSVLNAGIGGNRMLLDGFGPNALARFDRDVLGQPGVRHLILLEGVNDLGTLTRDRPATAEEHAALVRRLIAAYRQIVARARTHGIKVIGATILPYGGSDYYHPTPANEADRQAINAWIRAPGNFDAVIDFDRVMRDPARPDRLRPGYDSGDRLHPSPAGYRAMAEAIPLDLFAR